MSTVSRSAAVVVLLVALLVKTGAGARPLFYYLAPRQIDLTALLPPPPNVLSAQERADEQQVAAAVMRRGPAQLLEAEEDSMRTVFFFSKSIGPGFDSARLPVTTRLFSHVCSDVERLIDQAKTYWDRPRPGGVQKARG
jgi:acid phosphatase (class A)